MLGIPCLFAEPGATLAEWRSRLQFALEKLAADAAAAQASLQNPRLRPLTRDRLMLLNRAYVDQARRLQELLAPLGAFSPQGAMATHLALRTRLPADQGLTTYYPNVHRDWAWGADENSLCHDLVAGTLGPGPVGSLVVLGAGAGRLAWDLHQSGQAERTFAVDFNPLLMLIAARMVRGEELALWEFPLAPRRLADHARLRTLSAPAATRPGFQLLLADALRAPFMANSIDVVLTPWLVDILPEDLAVVAARVNGLLRPEGRWICFGSLAWTGRDPATCYSFEEALAIISEAGFTPPEVREDEIPYMCSPASRHGRRERVVTLTAARSRAVPRPPRPRSLPDWLVTGTQPVPALEGFQVQAATTRIQAFLMGLIDGRRSIRDMARLLEEQRLMTRADAEAAVRTFLTRMLDDSGRAGSS